MHCTDPVFRPPSEAMSLLLPVTIGCSHNRCAFCGMYATKRYGLMDLATIRLDVDEARNHRDARRAFLLDGDALAAPVDFLAEVLGLLRERLPWIERVGVYGDARAILDKGEGGMRRLGALGLGIVYHGLESGSDAVLADVGKPVAREDLASCGRILRAAGVKYSVMALLGLGGEARSDEHARATAEALNAMDPDYVGLLTLMLVPGTALHRRAHAGTFRLPGREAMLGELRTILAGLDLTRARFSANHASNYLPLTGDLPADKARLLAVADRILSTGDDSCLRPEWRRGL